jgi:uncharacterized lipoprotein YddW (UPF0748 family)
MKKLIIVLLLPVVLLACVKDEKAPEQVRGVWVPDPQYTDVMKTYDNIRHFVATLDSLNFNAIFMVSYALNKTLYPSEVLLRNSNYAHIDSTSLLSPYMGNYNDGNASPTGDPVRDLIDEAHKRNIKVIFWYEFGFMADIKLATPENNPVLAKNPHWVGIGNDGLPASYNNHDYYFNAFDPDVQQFVHDIVMEGISLYPDVDGVQGDDRLPAMCINSGYDAVTLSLYQQTFPGKTPPSDFRDSTWVRWRLDRLNAFGERLYKSVKDVQPNTMVSFAPNPYPWCMENLMQEWPQWVSGGICDLLAVQVYRRDSVSYRNTLVQAQSYFNPPAEKRTLFVPGVLLMVSAEISDPEMLRKQVLMNRELNTDGEIFFYNEGLKSPAVREVFRELYKQKADFPVTK